MSTLINVPNNADYNKSYENAGHGIGPDNNLFICVWGPPPAVATFVRALIERGWDCLPPRTTEPAEALDPAFRLLTSKGLTNVGDVLTPIPPELSFVDQNGNRLTHWPAVPEFSCVTVEDQIASWLQYGPDGYAPSAGDAVAAVIAKTWDGCAYDWMMLVIDSFYDAGLRFCFISHFALASPRAYRNVFWSAPQSEPQYREVGTAHCCAFTEAPDWYFQIVDRNLERNAPSV